MLEPQNKRHLVALLCSGLRTPLSFFVPQLCLNCHYGRFVFLSCISSTPQEQACLLRILLCVVLALCKRRIGVLSLSVELKLVLVVGWRVTEIYRYTDSWVTLIQVRAWHDLETDTSPNRPWPKTYSV